MSKNLVIKQATTLSETVTKDIIDKLYNLAYEDANLGIQPKVTSSTQDIVGTLQTQAAYEDAIDYLTNKFPNLTINAINKYIRFKDSVIGNILINEFGDGVGATRNQLSTVNNLNDRFFANRHTDFLKASTLEDLQYFSGISDFTIFNIKNYSGTEYVNAGIYNKPNISGIHYDNITTPKTVLYANTSNYSIEGSRWDGLLIFDSIDLSQTLFIATTTNASDASILSKIKVNFENLKLPKQIEYTTKIIYNCVIDKFIFPEGVTKTKDNFQGCSVSYVEYPTTITDIDGLFFHFRRDARQQYGYPANDSGCIVIKAVIPPEYVYPTGTNYANFPESVYVPDNSVEAYKTWASDFSDVITSRIKPMSSMKEEELALGTVTQEDMDRV